MDAVLVAAPKALIRPGARRSLSVDAELEYSERDQQDVAHPTPTPDRP